MTSFQRLALTASGLVLASTSSFAQFVEAEPNDSKATATVVAGMASGQTIDGNSISATTTGLDYFKVSTALAPFAIYRHQLAITTAGTAGHTGTLRGLTQTGTEATCPANGAGSTIGTTDASFQTSSTTSVPPRMNAWYGFGKGEEMYYRVTGGTTTTANYLATLTTTTVTPIAVTGTFQSGPISISTVNQTTTDTDIALFDSNGNAVLEAGLGYANNDDEHCTIAGITSGVLQSRMVRNLPAGTYYLGVSAYNGGTDKASPGDEGFMGGNVLDFPGTFASSSSSATASDRDVVITDGTNTYTASGINNTVAFGIVWYTFTVSGGGITAFCDAGVGGVIACPCGNPPAAAGKGCDNSAATGGASIAAAGSPNTAADTLVFTTSAQTANGTTIVLQGNAIAGGGAGVPFGQGVRCVGGTLKRLYVKSPGGTGGVTAPVGADPTVSAQSANLGDPIAPASTRYYMAYYRDPIVLGGCAATSTFNATNALQVLWQ
jgi:hypothetical protein